VPSTNTTGEGGSRKTGNLKSWETGESHRAAACQVFRFAGFHPPSPRQSGRDAGFGVGGYPYFVNTIGLCNAIHCADLLADRPSSAKLPTVKIDSGNGCSSANPAAGGLMRRESAFPIWAAALEKSEMALSTQTRL
jgi:hypothetical protein